MTFNDLRAGDTLIRGTRHCTVLEVNEATEGRLQIVFHGPSADLRGPSIEFIPAAKRMIEIPSGLVYFPMVEDMGFSDDTWKRVPEGAQLKTELKWTGDNAMNIDTIMHPRVPTVAETKGALQMTFAVAEAIREAGQVPSGTVYAALIGRVTLEGYTELLGILKGAGLVREDASHLLVWTGPALEVRS